MSRPHLFRRFFNWCVDGLGSQKRLVAEQLFLGAVEHDIDPSKSYFTISPLHATKIVAKVRAHYEAIPPIGRPMDGTGAAMVDDDDDASLGSRAQNTSQPQGADALPRAGAGGVAPTSGAASAVQMHAMSEGSPLNSTCPVSTTPKSADLTSPDVTFVTENKFGVRFGINVFREYIGHTDAELDALAAHGRLPVSVLTTFIAFEDFCNSDTGDGARYLTRVFWFGVLSAAFNPLITLLQVGIVTRPLQVCVFPRDRQSLRDIRRP